MEENLTLTFDSSIDSLVECNSSFDKGVLRICYTGQNRNGSAISKDTFERSMPSIYNCPVVCRYDRDADEIGGHDIELVKRDGGMYIANLTQPVGVVPVGAKYWWETITDGTKDHEYLCIDVILWKRQEAYQKIKDNGVTDQSMEILVKEGEMVDGVYVIKRFEFQAFCLLGTVEPCYESASLEVFSKSEFKAQFAEMMQEFKEAFSMIQSPENGVVIDQELLEGGNKALDEKNALIEEFGIDAATLDFSIEDFTVAELREKFQSMVAEQTDDTQKYALVQQFLQELHNALAAETVQYEWGESRRYWYVDHDYEKQEVYCEDTADWNLYGMTYSMDGDHVVINFDSKKRMKFAIVEFDEGEQGSMKELFEMASKKLSEMKMSAADTEQKYAAATTELESANAELVTLREFKTNAEKSEMDAKREELFSRFADLTEVESFKSLRENCSGLSLDELEEKCYALRGRYGTTANFSNNGAEGAPRLPAGGIYGVEDADEPYNGVFRRFGISAN